MVSCIKLFNSTQVQDSMKGRVNDSLMEDVSISYYCILYLIVICFRAHAVMMPGECWNLRTMRDRETLLFAFRTRGGELSGSGASRSSGRRVPEVP